MLNNIKIRFKKILGMPPHKLMPIDRIPINFYDHSKS